VKNSDGLSTKRARLLDRRQSCCPFDCTDENGRATQDSRTITLDLSFLFYSSLLLSQADSDLEQSKKQ